MTALGIADLTWVDTHLGCETIRDSDCGNRAYLPESWSHFIYGHVLLLQGSDLSGLWGSGNYQFESSARDFSNAPLQAER